MEIDAWDGTKNTIFNIGEVSDAAGNPILVVLELEPSRKGGELLDMNVVVSAYGKESKPANFIKNSELLYLDPNKKRTVRWLNAVGLQLPSVASTHLGFIGTITYIEGKVNIKGVPYNQYMQNLQKYAMGTQTSGKTKSSRKRNEEARDRIYELERENERQRKTIEYLRRQVKVRRPGEVDEKAARRATREIISRYGSTIAADGFYGRCGN